MPLCDLCQAISNVQPPQNNHWRDVKIYTHTLSTLTLSAQQKCYFCYQVYGKLSRKQLELLETNIGAEIDCRMIWDEEKWNSIFFSSSRVLPRLSIFVQYGLLPCEGQSHRLTNARSKLVALQHMSNCGIILKGSNIRRSQDFAAW